MENKRYCGSLVEIMTGWSDLSVSLNSDGERVRRGLGPEYLFSIVREDCSRFR